MNNIQSQKIFKSGAIIRMINDLKSGASLEEYFNEGYPEREGDILSTTIETIGEPPALSMPEDDSVAADMENAIALYEYYKLLDETQASDSRLWTYLSHVDFRKYALYRWGIKGKYEDYRDEMARKKVINQLLDHWFVGESDRALRRHALARLWWAAHLTYAPWEREPEFFGDMKKDDPYYFTRILLSTQDIYQQVLERSMGRSSHILMVVLEYLGKNIEFAQSRDKVRKLMKELNLVYGTKKIILLDRDSLRSVIRSLAEEIE
ncbi:MAG: DUF6339 family protein [Alphaproteobacteria bacterium]|nr:DUF6339 family protein [Alphaproteobacteria bacterium]